MKQVIVMLALAASVMGATAANAQSANTHKKNNNNNTAPADGQTPPTEHREPMRGRPGMRREMQRPPMVNREAVILRMKQAELIGMQKMAMADGRISRKERRLLEKEEHRLDKLTAFAMRNDRGMHGGPGRQGRPGGFGNRPGGWGRGPGGDNEDNRGDNDLPPGYFN